MTEIEIWPTALRPLTDPWAIGTIAVLAVTIRVIVRWAMLAWYARLKPPKQRALRALLRALHEMHGCGRTRPTRPAQCGLFACPPPLEDDGESG